MNPSLPSTFQFASLAALCVAALGARVARADDAAQPLKPLSPRAALPVRAVERPLTPPRRTLTPTFSGAYAHVSAFEVELDEGVFDLGIRYAVTDDVELYVQPASLVVEHRDSFFGTNDTRARFGVARVGGLFRLAHGSVAEVGIRAEIGAAATPTQVHLTAGVPLVLHGGPVRFETGAYFSTFFVVDSAFSPSHGGVDGGLATVQTSYPEYGLVTQPGVPARFTFQLADFISLGVDTGVGVRSFAEPGVYIPAEARFGATIPNGDQPACDLEVRAGLPAAYPLVTDHWELGLDTRFFIGL